jgi:hypothetical protein
LPRTVLVQGFGRFLDSASLRSTLGVPQAEMTVEAHLLNTIGIILPVKQYVIPVKTGIQLVRQTKCRMIM